MPAPELKVAIGLPPADAIAYFAARGHQVVTSWNWHDLWQEAHARAFTVAKVTQLDVIKDIRDSLREALEKGWTMDTWKKNLAPTLRAKGWWGKREVLDKATGELRNVDLSAPWRIRTIYRTNMQISFMAGRWQRFQENRTARPYWEYIAVMDLKTRPSHAALHKKVFRLDDPNAERLWPPNDFNCRCRGRALSEADLKRRGIKPENTDAYLTTREEDDPVTGLRISRTYYKSPTMQNGFVTGRGWDYNAGAASFQPRLDRYPAADAQEFLSESLRGPAFKRFLEGKDQASVPVGVVGEEIAAALGIKSRIVRFTADSRTKNIDHHPELSPEDYARLPDVLANPDYVIRDSDTSSIFLKTGDVWWRAVLKLVGEHEALMVSFHRTHAASLNRLLKKGTALKAPSGEK